jgi:hypothetical protein
MKDRLFSFLMSFMVLFFSSHGLGEELGQVPEEAMILAGERLKLHYDQYGIQIVGGPFGLSDYHSSMIPFDQDGHKGLRIEYKFKSPFGLKGYPDWFNIEVFSIPGNLGPAKDLTLPIFRDWSLADDINPRDVNDLLKAFVRFRNQQPEKPDMVKMIEIDTQGKVRCFSEPDYGLNSVRKIGSGKVLILFDRFPEKSRDAYPYMQGQLLRLRQDTDPWQGILFKDFESGRKYPIKILAQTSQPTLKRFRLAQSISPEDSSGLFQFLGHVQDIGTRIRGISNLGSAMDIYFHNPHPTLPSDALVLEKKGKIWQVAGQAQIRNFEMHIPGTPFRPERSGEDVLQMRSSVRVSGPVSEADVLQVMRITMRIQGINRFITGVTADRPDHLFVQTKPRSEQEPGSGKPLEFRKINGRWIIMLIDNSLLDSPNTLMM